jgi:hypothetical protein
MTNNLSNSDNQSINPVDLDTGAVEKTGARERPMVSFQDITLNVVSFDRNFSRNRGTLSQIIKSLVDMSERLGSPTNEYQKGLYPHIQSECGELVDQYNKLVKNIDPQDNNVFGYYLNGPQNNGKRKAISTYHEQKKYSMSEFKETLKSINDRLRHIKFDCKRKIDTAKDNDGTDTFNRVVTFCDDYYNVVKERTTSWDDFIKTFRETNGIVDKTVRTSDGNVELSDGKHPARDHYDRNHFNRNQTGDQSRGHQFGKPLVGKRFNGNGTTGYVRRGAQREYAGGRNMRAPRYGGIHNNGSVRVVRKQQPDVQNVQTN